MAWEFFKFYDEQPCRSGKKPHQQTTTITNVIYIYFNTVKGEKQKKKKNTEPYTIWFALNQNQMIVWRYQDEKESQVTRWVPITSFILTMRKKSRYSWFFLPIYLRTLRILYMCASISFISFDDYKNTATGERFFFFFLRHEFRLY